MAAVKNKAKPANMVKLMDKLSARVLCERKVMLIEQTIRVTIDQNRMAL